jgi:hypothetical protein
MGRHGMVAMALVFALAGCSVSEHSSVQTSLRYRGQSIDGGKAMRFTCLASSSGVCRVIVQHEDGSRRVRDRVAVGQSLRLPWPPGQLRACVDTGEAQACRPQSIDAHGVTWIAEGSRQSASVHEDVSLRH